MIIIRYYSYDYFQHIIRFSSSRTHAGSLDKRGKHLFFFLGHKSYREDWTYNLYQIHNIDKLLISYNKKLVS